MFTVTGNQIMPTTITGSLPRPAWFERALDGRPFLVAMARDIQFREQYSDAVAVLISDQLRAGLDIVTDGDMRCDADVGGRAWFGYMFERMTGLSDVAARPGNEWQARESDRPRAQIAGDILHEVMEARLPPLVTAEVGAGELQYDALWKAAQRVSAKPVKLGFCCAQMADKHVINRHYGSRLDSVMAFSEAVNGEYHRMVDAGASIIQVEEPCLHFRADGEWDVSLDEYVEAFNREVAGLRDRAEVWCHTCWGNPLAQKIEAGYRYKPVLPWLDQLDVDVLTFETADNGGEELAQIAAAVSRDKKICIGVVTHRTLEVEKPHEVAALIRRALEHIEPERLVLSTDCGFGRQGMSRVHAYYKMVAISRGANIVRRELGLEERPVPAAEERFSFL